MDKSYSEYSQMSIDIKEEEKEKNNKDLTELLSALKLREKTNDDGKYSPPIRNRSNSNNSFLTKLNSGKFGSPNLNSPSMKFSSLDKTGSQDKFINVPSVLEKLNSRSGNALSPKLDDKNSTKLAKQRLKPITKPSHRRERKNSESSILSSSSKFSNSENSSNKEIGKSRSNLEELLAKSDEIIKSMDESHRHKNNNEKSLDNISEEEMSDEEIIIQAPPEMPQKRLVRRGSTASTSSQINFDEMLFNLEEMSITLPEKNNNDINNKDNNDGKLINKFKDTNEKDQNVEKKNENDNDERKVHGNKIEESKTEENKIEENKTEENKTEENKTEENKEEENNAGFGFKGIITNFLKNNSISKSDNETSDLSEKEDNKDESVEEKPQENGGSIFDKFRITTRSSSNKSPKISADKGNNGSIFDKFKIPSRSSSSNSNKIPFSPNLRYFNKKNDSNSSPTQSEDNKAYPLIKSDQRNENITNKEREKDKESEIQLINSEKAKVNLINTLKEQKSNDISSTLSKDKDNNEENDVKIDEKNKNENSYNEKKEKDEVEKGNDNNNKEEEKEKDLERPKKYKSILKAPKEYPMPEELRKLEDLRLEEAKRDSSIRHSRRLVEKERRKSRSRERLHDNEKEKEKDNNSEKKENKEDVDKSRLHSMLSKSRHSSRSASRHHESSRNHGEGKKDYEDGIQDSEERRRRHTSRHTSRRNHVSRRLPPETEEERARRHASRHLETEEERARRHSRRHISRKLDVEERRRRERRQRDKEYEGEGEDGDKNKNKDNVNNDEHEKFIKDGRSRRMSERRHHRHRHRSTSDSHSKINISGDILPEDINNQKKEGITVSTLDPDKLEGQEIKKVDIADISDLKDDQPHSAAIVDSEDIVIPDRALHMEEKLYTRGRFNSEASNTSLSSIGSESGIISQQSTDSNGNHHHHHHRSRTHSHSKGNSLRDSSSLRDRRSSVSSDSKKRNIRNSSSHHRSVRPDGSHRTPNSPLVTEQDRENRYEHGHRNSSNISTAISSLRIRTDIKSDSENKPEIFSSLKKSHRISSMARPPRIATRTSLRIEIPNPRDSMNRKSSASSDISINALMDEMRQMMTGTPSREPKSPFIRELNKLDSLQKSNEEGLTPLIIENDIDRQGSETYRDHIMHKFNRMRNSRNSHSLLGRNSVTSINSMDLWKKGEERQFHFLDTSSQISNENSLCRNIENLKLELEELTTDKEKRRSKLSLSTNRSSHTSIARNSKFDDTYLKSLLEKLSDTKTSKRYSQRSSRIMNDIASRKSINIDEIKKEVNEEINKEEVNKKVNKDEALPISKEEEKVKNKPEIQDANDEENNKLLSSLQECEEKFDSLNKDLNTILFSSIKLFDNILSS
jgi:hypothetical protein